MHPTPLKRLREEVCPHLITAGPRATLGTQQTLEGCFQDRQGRDEQKHSGCSDQGLSEGYLILRLRSVCVCVSM